mmetsp:Transcript_8866/g.20757  ORF Transcript_8866/g.20757 Transcript_8866/m.20757 type:complete len:456 (+) Transcript_8866:66-1433(+)
MAGGAHIQHPPDDAPVPESMAQCQRQQTHCIWPLQYAACPVVHCTLVPCSAPRMFQQQQQQQPHVNSMVQQAGDGGRIATCRGLHQRTSSDTCHLKLLMSEHFVGAIMGNAGCDIEEVVANTGCRLQVSALDQHYPGTNDRIVVLSGELPGLKECVRMILWKLYTLYPHNHGRMVATLAVPSSAVSRIVGRKGEAVKQISFSTECHVRVSCRVDGFQERLVLISGEYPNLVEAVSKVCRYIQGDPHLLEHLALSYDIALPFNCWVGKKTRATQIISPADVQRHNKRELVHYLRRTASRKILRRYSLLGNTKNIMKANSVEQLHRAVIETHEELQAQGLVHAAAPSRSYSVVEGAEHSEDSDATEAPLDETIHEETSDEEFSQLQALEDGSEMQLWRDWSICRALQAWLSPLGASDAMAHTHCSNSEQMARPRHCPRHCSSVRVCSRGLEGIFGGS